MPESNRGRRFEVVTVCFVVIVSILLLTFVFSLGRQNGEAIGEYVANSDTYARQTEEQIKECLAFTDDASESVCIREVVEATNENERAASDLVAQTEMSLWALCMLIATIIMTLITAAGVWFVKGTLEQSVLATKAAQAAVAVTKEGNRDANRAYVDIDAVNFYWGSPAGQWPEIKIFLRNCGATPAKWYQIRQSYTLYPHDAASPFGETFSSLPVPDQFGKRWNGIPPGAQGMRTSGPVIQDSSAVRKCLRWPIQLDVTPVDNTHGIAIFGEVRYCTAFDEIYLSQFFFGLPSLEPFDSKETKIIDSQVINGMPHTLSRTEEIPQIMMKFPMDLDLYKPEKQKDNFTHHSSPRGLGAFDT